MAFYKIVQFKKIFFNKVMHVKPGSKFVIIRQAHSYRCGRVKCARRITFARQVNLAREKKIFKKIFKKKAIQKKIERPTVRVEYARKITLERKRKYIKKKLPNKNDQR